LRGQGSHQDVFEEVRELIKTDFPNSLAQKKMDEKILQDQSENFLEHMGWAPISYVESFIYLRK
jgi:hypothetical protein